VGPRGRYAGRRGAAGGELGLIDTPSAVKKIPYQTSLVHWHLGQALLPEHFQAAEQALRGELDLRLRMQAAPAWGLGSLQWDDFQLSKGIVVIEEMTLLLRSGALVDIPGNTAPVSLSLVDVDVTGASVYLHLQAEHRIARVGEREATGEGIQRIQQQVTPSIEPYVDGAVESFKLAELDCDPGGRWSLRSDYLPPLLRIGDSPFFADQMRKARDVTETVKQALARDIREQFLSTEIQASARQCLRGVLSFQHLLSDFAQGIYPHPYDFFRALRALYTEVCVYHGADPGPDIVYRHETPAECFGALLSGLWERAKAPREAAPYIPFVQQGGVLECALAGEITRARDVYFLIQKPQVSARLDLSGMKLASPSRLHTVYERALRGVPFERIESPPFHHGLSANVEFFALSPGREWDHAVREAKLMLFDVPELASCRIYLYWRAGERS